MRNKKMTCSGVKCCVAFSLAILIFSSASCQKASVEKGLYPSYASWVSRDQTGMKSNAFALVKKMVVGWNLGNSLEVPNDETAWGNSKTTQVLIDSIKKASIN